MPSLGHWGGERQPGSCQQPLWGPQCSCQPKFQYKLWDHELRQPVKAKDLVHGKRWFSLLTSWVGVQQPTLLSRVTSDKLLSHPSLDRLHRADLSLKEMMCKQPAHLCNFININVPAQAGLEQKYQGAIFNCR